METPFDLNQAIQHWRKNLGQSTAFSSENLEELESHLRDSTGKLVEIGLSAEEAFLIAVRRCGNRQQLESEFAKPRRIGAFRKVLASVAALLALILGAASYPLFYLIHNRYAIMGIDSSIIYPITTPRGWLIFLTDLLIALLFLWAAFALLRRPRRHA